MFVKRIVGVGASTAAVSRQLQPPSSSNRLYRFAVANMSSSKLSQTMESLEMAPPDAILGLTEAFQKDSHPKKVLLGAGAYRDDDGKPYLLPSVTAAEKKMLEQEVNHEYAPIAGFDKFIKHSQAFAFGSDSKLLSEGRLAGVQALSGTGSLRVAAEFVNKFLGKNYPIYLPTPTWGNHPNIMKNAGLEVFWYRYYHTETRGLDFEGLIKDLQAAPEGAIVLLHAVAHNPTGVDPSMDQWAEILEAVKSKNLIPLLDCAYQGYASGDAERDAAAIRLFADSGLNFILAQSFAKNFGLYGERAGCLSFVCNSSHEADKVKSQLKAIIRPMYSSPPIHGANIVSTIFEDPALYAEWKGECKAMADRIMAMRKTLRKTIEVSSSQSWQHITDQIGMFCYTGLSKEQVQKLREEYHIYMTADGRISMAGVNTKNVDYIAEAITKVVG